MKATAIRGIVLLGLIMAIAATLRLANRIVPRIKCSADVQEGKVFYCSASLEYPPDAPSYRWSIDGECTPDGTAGQTIQLMAPAQDKCTMRVSVYDSAGKHLVGMAVQPVSIRRSSIPEAPGPVAVERATKLAGKSVPQRKTEPAARLDIKDSAWPAGNERWRVDEAPIQGRVIGADSSTYKVAIYTLTGAGWSLQGTAAIDPSTGSWDLLVHIGSSYAAMLVKKSFEPESRMKTLPAVGGAIVDLKKSQ